MTKPTLTCALGNPCDWDRFVSHTGYYGSEKLSELVLCEHHQQRFDETKPGVVLEGDDD